jgi:predicted nucleotidyltransferase
MKNSSIDLSKKCDQSIISCLTEIRDQAEKMNMDFVVVGALVRILILEQYYNLSTGVATRDIDIGITVIDWDHYEKLRNSLIFTGSFTEDKKKIYHRLWHNKKYPVDIIPFGAVESSEGLIQWPPDQSIEMNVTGFQDALNDAVIVHLSDKLDVRFVSLPGMAILKLIAWHDRHNEFPTKDAIDIATLLKYYPDAGNDERMFNEHPDLMEIENFDFEMAGARLLGRDMAAIMSRQTKETVLEILYLHTDPDRNDILVQAITRWIPDKNYEKALRLLKNLEAGILDRH